MSEKICRLQRKHKFRCGFKRAITNQMQSGWNKNERERAISGDRTRPACWFRRRAETIFLPTLLRSGLQNFKKSPRSRERARQHARRVRSPNDMTTRWTRKDLLGLRELSADEINFILETADAFKEVGTREIKKVPALRGKTLVNFFVEPSTRTRTSFELAAFRLSADVINISATTSSLTKGETLKDTARNLEALHADILVL